MDSRLINNSNDEEKIQITQYFHNYVLPTLNGLCNGVWENLVQDKIINYGNEICVCSKHITEDITIIYNKEIPNKKVSIGQVCILRIKDYLTEQKKEHTFNKIYDDSTKSKKLRLKIKNIENKIKEKISFKLNIIKFNSTKSPFIYRFKLSQQHINTLNVYNILKNNDEYKNLFWLDPKKGIWINCNIGNVKEDMNEYVKNKTKGKYIKIKFFKNKKGFINLYLQKK